MSISALLRAYDSVEGAIRTTELGREAICTPKRVALSPVAHEKGKPAQNGLVSGPFAAEQILQQQLHGKALPQIQQLTQRSGGFWLVDIDSTSPTADTRVFHYPSQVSGFLPMGLGCRSISTDPEFGTFRSRWTRSISLDRQTIGYITQQRTCWRCIGRRTRRVLG
jgi:hypothetical protein